MNDSSTPEQIAAERRVRRQLSTELAVQPRQVEAAVDLLDGGATVPFIARSRKEATDGLDDTQLRTLEERLIYLRDLESRRLAIIASIRSLPDDAAYSASASDAGVAVAPGCVGLFRCVSSVSLA